MTTAPHRLHEQLQDLADELPGPRTSHAAAAQAAWTARRRPPRRAWVPVAAVCAVAAVLLLVAVAPTSGLRRGAQVTPASGPGALPVRVFAPPSWTPLVTEAPVERAAYVLATREVRRGPFSRGIAPVVVSADGGAYRVLPWHEGDHGLSLSPDGRRVAWVQGGFGGPETRTRVVVLTLATGRLVAQPDDARAPSSAEGTSWSDDGTRLVVWGVDYVSTAPDAGGKGNAYVLDARTLRVVSMKEGFGRAVMVGQQVLDLTSVVTGARTGLVLGDAIAMAPDAGRLAVATQTQVGSTWDSQGTRVQEIPPIAVPRLVVRSTGGRVVTDRALADAVYADVLGWGPRGVAVVAYGAGWRDVAPRVELVDPATGRALATLTELPPVNEPDLAVDIDPQVVAVAADVLAGGRTAATPPPRWGWWSVEHLRWWLSAPLAVALELGLALAVVLLVRLAVVTARADRDARR